MTRENGESTEEKTMASLEKMTQEMMASLVTSAVVVLTFSRGEEKTGGNKSFYIWFIEL